MLTNDSTLLKMILNTLDFDVLRLQSLGYKQELTRAFTRLTNYGMSLSVISVTSGLSSLFSYGMITGGPVVMIWGWLIVCFFTLFIVFGMAEICSAYPTSGGLYYWTGILVPQRHKALVSWFTGWFNLIGQFTITTAIDFSLAMLIASVISLSLNFQWSPERYHIILIYLIIIISHGICNSLGIRFLSWLIYISTWWQLLAPIIVSLALLIGAKSGHQSIKFVFTEFKNETGWTNKIYVILMGLLPAHYVLTGYNASAHITEETKQADKASPWGMINAILVSIIIGWIFLIAFFFGIHDYETTIRTSTGFPIIQILLDNFNNELTLFFMCLLLIACWFSGLASVTTNSRMIYAFSRDNAMPGSCWWHIIHPRLSCPLNAVWLSCFIAFLLALPYLGNTTTFVVITSLSTVCLYISYILPIVCKLLYPNAFLRGPFHLGIFSKFINIIALLWVCLIIVLFVLPPIYPITAVTMNYASVGVGIVYYPVARSSGWLVDQSFKQCCTYSNHMEMFCGGTQLQWNVHRGKCSICGEPYDKPAKLFEKGGAMYTANHKGHFEFRLCNVDSNPNSDATQECLDRRVLKIAGTDSTRIRDVDKYGTATITVRVQLPSDVACRHCVFQWKYTAGNNWGTDPITGQSGLGMGIENETFMGCSDISINGNGSPIETIPPIIVTPGTPATTTTKTSSRPPSGSTTWSSNGVQYKTNDIVLYEGKKFQCIADHTSFPGAEPGILTWAWWKPIN
ncbi:unnamed protein product [Rotaria sordida]|uniref:Chitin-binding type-3 domain-containing protein n=1 Tax=Rotaria sordida TaxID=392033 RepID=A0A813NG55_9BILA|nr:unnamed protein product [Rotaria sordida]CAF0801704.1 unnamed protein product [Rotaria sordida]